jgi:hypothetical protein
VIRIIVFIVAGICLVWSCKEPDMIESSPLLPKPVAIPFYKGEVNNLFAVAKKKSIGMTYDGDNFAIAEIQGDDLELDDFPKGDTFSGYLTKPLFQSNQDTLFVNGDKFLFALDWKNKKVISFFEEMSRAIEGHFEISKIIKENHQILSLWYFSPEEGEDKSEKYFLTIDDVINRKRIKEIPILDPDYDFPVFFTPTHVIYHSNDSSPWKVIDNNLEETTHPIVDLLKKYEEDSVFFAFNKETFISENNEQSLIISYNLIVKKDMLFLASWNSEPKVQPIVIDSSLIGNRRLVNNSGNNTMSPSGHWVYFCARAERFDPDRHFLIYLDPKLPNGCLLPMRLGLEGSIGCAGWVTEPEGLVLYMNNQLLYYDLSRFDPRKAAQKEPVL